MMINSHREKEESYLRDFFQVLMHRWGVILLSTLCCAVLAALWSFLQTPEFESTATLLIEHEYQGPLQKSNSPVADSSPDYYETHFELLKSRRVIEKAAHALKLLERSEYTVPAGWAGGEQPLDPWEQALVRFEQKIKIKPVRGARLAKIIAQSNDASFAAEAANAIASAYIQLNEEVHAKKQAKALEWFSSNLGDLRKRVEQSQEALSSYRNKYGVVEVGERQTPSGQRFTELSSELVKLEIRVAEAESRYQQTALLLSDKTSSGGIDWSKWEDLSEVLSSPLIQVLRAEEIKSSVTVAELAEKYGPLHPKIKGAEAELQNLRERILGEVRKIQRSLMQERNVLARRLGELRAVVGRQKRDVMQFDEHHAKQSILDREVKSAQQMYDVFLTGAMEASLASELVAANVVIADLAIPASSPIKPRKVANIILGLLTGLIFGIGFALCLDHWNQSLKGSRDLASYLPGVTFLGAIPRLTHRTAKESLIFSGLPALPALEAVRSIRVGILSSGMVSNHGSLVITSPGLKEGKSALAVNLALVMAQTGDVQVLLLDADLRTPRDSGSPVLPNDGERWGLAHFLNYEAEFEDVIYRSSGSHLWTIPRGKISGNASELLTSNRMKDLLEKCHAKKFFVIIDTPPVTLFSDPLLLGSHADGVILVVAVGQTDREACQQATYSIIQSGAKLLGVVLQKAVGPRQSHYSRYVRNM